MVREMCLYSLEQAGVVVLQSGQPSFFNQVGGTEYRRRDAEGWFVPLSNDPMEGSGRDEYLDALLAEVFRAKPVGLSIAQADEVDDLLMQLSSSDQMRVDRSKLADSEAGWVFVEVSPMGDFSQFAGVDSCSGVLTWPNKYHL